MYSYRPRTSSGPCWQGPSSESNASSTPSSKSGRSRKERWSFAGSLIYDRDGTLAFYGIGNESPQSEQTSFTEEQSLVQAQIGLNLSNAWQLLYTGRVRIVDVLPAHLPGILRSRVDSEALSWAPAMKRSIACPSSTTPGMT